MLFKKTGCVLLAILLQACVTVPQYTPMTADTQQAIQTLEVYNVVVQDEVRPAVETSNVTGAMGGGLIAAAIDSSINDSRANSARDLTDQFYISTEDVDYRMLLAQALNPVFANYKHMNPRESAEVLAMQDKQIKQKVASLKQGEAFMFLTTFYAFVDEFKLLQTRTTAYLYVGNGGQMDYQKASYKNDFLYQSPTVGAGGASSIALWSADNGALFRQQLTYSLQSLQSNMRYDMQPLGKEPCLNTMTFAYPTPIGELNLTGNTVKTAGDNSVLRTKDGALYTLTTVALKPAKKNSCGA